MDVIERTELNQNKNVPLDLIINHKRIYHGSPIHGITEMKTAENTTIGNGVYFTSDKKAAEGYAIRRSKLGKGEPVVYEGNIENVRFANLTTNKNVNEVVEGLKEVLRNELSNPDLRWHRQQVIQNTIKAIESGEINPGNLRNALFSNGDSFTKYLENLGYEGLVALEGGEGEEVSDHDTYLIFDSNTIKNLKEIET